MPGIDFHRLRREITMRQVLDLLGFQATRCRGDQWYGYCPLHASTRATAFSVNVEKGCYYCHQCHRHGDQLQLWAEATETPLHPAVIDLCGQLGVNVPWVHRW